MRRLSFLLALIVFISCNQQPKKDTVLLEEKITRIENGLQPNLQIKYGDSIGVQYFNIEERMKELGIPGVSIAMLHDGKIEWAKGYGMADSTENRKVTINTLFQAGSISKPVAATRAHQLAEQGVISIDSNVNDYLSSWKLPDNEFTVEEKVSLRRILNHSAGLTVWGFPGYAKGDTIPSIPEILDGKGNTDSVRVYKKPGESWMYSGGGYTIMQLLITDLEKEQFPKIMKDHVLNPLGMEASTYENPLPEQYHGLAATGYHSGGKEVEGKWHAYPEMAAAGLWTTPSELILWGKEIQEILQTQKDGILKAETVNEMLIPSEDQQGLGPYVLDLTFGHGGADEGFRAELLVWKETGDAVVIMVNSNKGSAIAREILLSIVQEYDLPDYTPTFRSYNAQPQEKLKRFIGTYNFQGRGDSEMSVTENGLEFSGGIFSEPIYLLPEKDSLFFNKNSGTYYKFQFKDDQVTGVKFSSYHGKKVNNRSH